MFSRLSLGEAGIYWGQEMTRSLIMTLLILCLMTLIPGQMSTADELAKSSGVAPLPFLIYTSLEKPDPPRTVQVYNNREIGNERVQQLIREIIPNIGPEETKHILDAAAVLNRHGLNISVNSGIPRTPLRTRQLSTAGELPNNARQIEELEIRDHPTTLQLRRGALRERMAGSDSIGILSNRERQSSSKNFRKNSIGLITNSSNRVHSLNLDEVRRIFSGEYTNWSQVGGNNRLINLITSIEGVTGIESILDTTMASSAVTVPFLSFVYVGVAENEGAAGFLLPVHMEQLEILKGHGAIKKIAINTEVYYPD